MKLPALILAPWFFLLSIVFSTIVSDLYRIHWLEEAVGVKVRGLPVFPAVTVIVWIAARIVAAVRTKEWPLLLAVAFFDAIVASVVFLLVMFIGASSFPRLQ